ncbi:hypothetical protein [Streptomyces scopuliridis]|uniref:hypothetical protein n=1 Tax=Streptomyces scopuliridis TaxID=452529 RepID=UPI00342FA310
MTEDSRYTPYMQASAKLRVHDADCTACQPNEPEQRCESGAGLYERFARLQNVYLQRLKDRT